MRLKSVVKEGKGINEFARYDDEGKEKKRRYLRRRTLLKLTLLAYSCFTASC